MGHGGQGGEEGGEVEGRGGVCAAEAQPWYHLHVVDSQDQIFAHLRESRYLAHIRQSKPDSGVGVQVKVLKTCQGVPSSLGSGQEAQPRYHLQT